MKRTNYIMAEWTPEELFYKLFCKKICPNCLGKLEHRWKKQYVGQRRPFGGGLLETNQYFDVYKCENCNREYSIGELAKERKRKKREA